MFLKTVGRAVLVLAAMTAAACSEEETASTSQLSAVAPSTSQQQIRSENKVLILGSSVADGLNSREAQAVIADSPSAQIDVVTPDQWRAMTAQQFMTYRAIIIGDAACTSGTDAFQAAIDNRKNWGAIVDGDVAILSTDPTSNGTGQLVENGIRYVLNSVQMHTGMYIALGCAYQDAPPGTPVTLLEPFGEFTIQGVPGCADSAHIFEMYNDFMSRDMWDGLLSGEGGCAARSVFTRYPDREFSYAGVAMSSSGVLPSQQLFTDFTVDYGNETPVAGAPYILVRGAMNMGAGCGLLEVAPSGEECDLGDGLNGQPAFAGQSAVETCSFSCRRNWCGDGVVDREFGEECDNGEANGRTGDASGNIGNCTSFCKLPHVEAPAGKPPVALCHDVTQVAEYTCGADASIDNGSYDEDGDLMGCTQSVAGPYNIGDTKVTLTCTDKANHSTSCTGVVTVVDHVAPTVALNGPANQALECIKGGTYSDPGASASDQCVGQLAVSSITKVGSVNVAVPNTYSLSYSAADASGNQSEPVYRAVTVADTLSPVFSGLSNVTVECKSPAFIDTGVSAFDQCEGDVTSKIVRTGSVDTAVVGDYQLRYDVQDTANHAALQGRRTVTVRDATAPVVAINLPVSQTVECGGIYADPGATASDTCAGPLTASLSASTINMAVPGNYAINYKATDPSGNVGYSADRAVTVQDSLPPTLALNGPASSSLECGSAYVDPGATASDLCAGALAVTVSGSVNSKAPASYTLHYSANDGHGHSVAADRTVVVVDTQVPAISLVGGAMTLQCNGAPFVDPGATATDACSGNLTSKITSISNLDQTRAGQYTVTYSVKDTAGNLTTASRQLTVGACTNSCIDVSLSDYNLFLQGDYTNGVDIVGKLAAGGNISMTNFAVGGGLAASDTSNVLVAGGNLTLANGTVYGNTYYGGTLSKNQGVTFQRGTAAKGTPIDFTARFAELRSLSSRLGSLTANGNTKRESWGTITLTGTNSNVNVFDVSASAFTGAVGLNITVPSGSFVVVNIRGASATFQNFGHSFSGVDQHNVLYNFVDTTTINASSYGFWGTVLAPNANITFNNGSFDGGIYAKSMNGNAEGHINTLNPRTICP